MKRFYSLSIRILVLSLIGFFLVHERGQIINSVAVWNKKIDFEYPQYAIQDADEFLYVVDRSHRRIQKLNKEGFLEFELIGGKREEGGFFFARDLQVDNQGNLYVHNQVLDLHGMFVEREELLRYFPNGHFDKIVYQMHHKPHSTLVQRGSLYGLQIQDNRLQFLFLEEHQVTGFMLNSEQGAVELVGRIDFPNARQWISSLDWNAKQGFFATLKNGKIKSYDWTGQIELLFDGDKVALNTRTVQSHLARTLPWGLKNTGDGLLIFIDLSSQSLVSLSSKQADAAIIFDYQRRIQQEPSASPSIYYRFTYQEPGLILTTDEYSILGLGINGDIFFQKDHALRSWNQVLWQSFVYFSLVVWVLVFIQLIWHIYANLLMRRVSLLIKQALILAPLLSLSTLIVTNMVINYFDEQIVEEKIQKVSMMAQSFAQTVDPDLFEGFEAQSSYWNDEYKEIRKEYHKALNYNKDQWNEGYYFALYRVIDNNIYGFMYLNDQIGISHPFLWFNEPNSVYKKAFNGQVAAEITTDVSGDWLYGVAPIINEQGETLALVEVGTELFTYLENKREMYLKTLYWVAIATIGLLVVIIFFTMLLLRTLRKLRKGVLRLADGHWDTEIVINSNDEVNELADTFNSMSVHIKNYIKEINALNRSYRRFVPEQFLHYLGHPSVVNVKLGDQVQKDMTILFSDIRSFTALSEQMTPAENFNFLNQYLGIMGPHIRMQSGFIDKYIGDAIMALFPLGVDYAIAAAVGMQSSLVELNNERHTQGKEVLAIGIGIHAGSCMLGILGEAERMEGTVISDHVNIASRLEGLTKLYGAGLIVSDAVFNLVEDQDKLTYRYLGKVQVKGKTQSIRIFEILNGAPVQERDEKMRSCLELERALNAYEHADFELAIQVLNRLSEDYPNDRVVNLYLESSIQLAVENQGIDQWDGALIIKSKSGEFSL